MVKRGVEKRDELPVITALSIVRGKDGWSVVTLKIQGDKVLSVEHTSPDMKAIANESFRIKAAKEFFS